MRRDGERSQRHVARLGYGRLGEDAGGLEVVDYVVEVGAQERQGGPRGVGVELDVGVFCGGGVEEFGGEGDCGLLEGFWCVEESMLVTCFSLGRGERDGSKGGRVDVRAAVKVLPRFSGMLP